MSEDIKKRSDIKGILFAVSVVLIIVVPIVFFTAKRIDDKKQTDSSAMFEVVYESLKSFDNLNLASREYEAGNIIEKLDEVIDVYPGTISAKRALFYKGYTSYFAGDVEKAEEYFNEFVSKNKKSYLAAKAYYFLSFVYYEMEDLDKAVSSLDFIIKKLNDAYYIPLAYYRSAQLYELKNDKDKALELYNTLISGYSNSSQAEAAKKRVALIENDLVLFN